MPDHPNLERISQEIRQLIRSNGRVEDSVIEQFISTIHMAGDKVCGFQYTEIEKRLSEQEYIKLLNLLGFDPAHKADWENNICVPGRGCVAEIGYACNFSLCH